MWVKIYAVLEKEKLNTSAVEHFLSNYIVMWSKVCKESSPVIWLAFSVTQYLFLSIISDLCFLF